jgi:hypothetical protein
LIQINDAVEADQLNILKEFVNAATKAHDCHKNCQRPSTNTRLMVVYRREPPEFIIEHSG